MGQKPAVWGQVIAVGVGSHWYWWKVSAGAQRDAAPRKTPRGIGARPETRRARRARQNEALACEIHKRFHRRAKNETERDDASQNQTAERLRRHSRASCAKIDNS